MKQYEVNVCVTTEDGRHGSAGPVMAYMASEVDARIAELEKEAAIADVVWKFIDRMGDIDPQYDPAEKILNEFYSAVHPAIEAALPKRPL